MNLGYLLLMNGPVCLNNITMAQCVSFRFFPGIKIAHAGSRIETPVSVDIMMLEFCFSTVAFLNS